MKRTSNPPVLDRLLDPVCRSLNVDAAQKLLALRADAVAQARMDELASKCNEGLLTPDERGEYETYVVAGTLIAILKAKARRIVAKQAAS